MLSKICHIASLLTLSPYSILGAALTQIEWSCLLVLIVFTIILWTVYRIRLTRNTNRVCNLLAERLSERERKASELNDTLLQGMQGLILLFQGAVVEIPSETPLASRLETAIDRAEQLMVEARDRVRGLHAPNLDLADALRSLNAEEPQLPTHSSMHQPDV
jgi:signal transduction histidine kinase